MRSRAALRRQPTARTASRIAAALPLRSPATRATILTPRITVHIEAAGHTTGRCEHRLWQDGSWTQDVFSVPFIRQKLPQLRASRGMDDRRGTLVGPVMEGTRTAWRWPGNAHRGCKNG